MNVRFFNQQKDLAQVVYYDQHIAILYKPAQMHSVSLTESTHSLENFWYRHPLVNPSLPQGGLLQRLDYLTAGLVCASLDQDSYNYFKSNKQGITKGYHARCSLREPYFAPDGYEVEHWQAYLTSIKLNESVRVTVQARFVYQDNKRNAVRLLAVNTNSRHAIKKSYITQLEITRSKHNSWQVTASLSQGYRHQVRATLSALGLVIEGDELYGAVPVQSTGISFWATSLHIKFNQEIKNYHIEWKNFL